MRGSCCLLPLSVFCGDDDMDNGLAESFCDFRREWRVEDVPDFFLRDVEEIRLPEYANRHYF